MHKLRLDFLILDAVIECSNIMICLEMIHLPFLATLSENLVSYQRIVELAWLFLVKLD